MKKKKTAKKEVKGRNTSSVTVRNANSHANEVAALVIGAFVLLLFMSFIGKAGTLGNGVKFIFFSILGAPASYMSLAVMIAIAFCLFRGNASRVFRVRNDILLAFFILFVSAFIFLCCEKENVGHEFDNILKESWNNNMCGLCDGMLSLFLWSLMEKVATYVVVITGMLVTAVLLFSLSIVRLFKSIREIAINAGSKVRRMSRRFKDDKKRKQASAETNNADKKENDSDPVYSEPAGGYTITLATGETADMTTGEIISEADEKNQNVVTDDGEGDFGKIPSEQQIQMTIPMAEKEKYVYEFPSVELLQKPDENERKISHELIQNNAQKLEDAMRSFGVSAKVINVTVGPNVVRYELQPQAGVKVSQITGLSNDIALTLATKGSVRIEAPIPGKAAIGIEIPNEERYKVYLREIIESSVFKNAKSPLTVCLGKDVEGKPIVADVKKMPHLLIGGTTGSGKSILINSIIVSLIYKSSPEDVRMILLDPKIVELPIYNGIPHLLFPVVTDSKKAAGALSWAVEEMERRYSEFALVGERELDTFNEYVKNNPEEAAEKKLEKLPSIVIVIDELADLMSVAKDAVETSINRLAAKARAAGIHLIIATQRPSVNVVTGTIKANVPARLALYVSSFVDSKTIIDCAGAEKLLGYGDMLYSGGGHDSLKRIQGAYVDKEIREIVKTVSEKSPVVYDSNIISGVDNHAKGLDKGSHQISDGSKGTADIGADDEYLEQAVKTALQYKKVSASFLQTKLGIGFQRATRIVQWMEDNNVISEREGNNSREILIESMDDYYKIIHKEGEKNER